MDGWESDGEEMFSLEKENLFFIFFLRSFLVFLGSALELEKHCLVHTTTTRDKTREDKREVFFNLCGGGRESEEDDDFLLSPPKSGH